MDNLNDPWKRKELLIMHADTDKTNGQIKSIPAMLDL